MPYKDLTPPPGDKITRAEKLTVPDHPVIPFIEGDGTGPDIWRRACACSMPRSKRPTAGSERSRGWKSSPARRLQDNSTTGCRTKRSAAFREYLVGIKGPLTTPVGGGIRSLNVALRQMLDLFVCLRPVQLFQGRPLAREASGEGRHGDLPREHRGHLRRHRVRRRHAGSAEGARLPREGVSRRSSRRSASARKRGRRTGRRSSKRSARPSARSASGRHRHQAGQLSRHRAPGAQRDRLRDSRQAQERDAGAQGQHHEVHRGRLPRLGLRGREGVLRRGRKSTAGRGARFPTGKAGRRASSSRTRSPTSRCSRC